MIYFRENVWTLNHYFKKIKIKTEIKRVLLLNLNNINSFAWKAFRGQIASGQFLQIMHQFWAISSLIIRRTPTDSELHFSVFRATGRKRKSIILQINVQNVQRLTCCRFLQEGYFRSSAQNSRVEPWQVEEILIPLFLAFLTLQCRSLSVSRLIFLLSVGSNFFLVLSVVSLFNIFRRFSLVG